MIGNAAKQRIEYISGFMKYPEGLCKEGGFQRISSFGRGNI